MVQKKISIRRADKLRLSDAHERIYEDLNELLGTFLGKGKDTHEIATDTKFFLGEIADNFLVHDNQFFIVDIDITIDESSHEITLLIKHDGVDFNPLSSESNCTNIKSAIDRLQIKHLPTTLGESISRKINIKYKLKK